VVLNRSDITRREKMTTAHGDMCILMQFPEKKVKINLWVPIRSFQDIFPKTLAAT
jgi:hypothetical protein